MKIKLIGRCLACGAIHRQEVSFDKVEQWIKPESVWCICGNQIHGIKWGRELDTTK